MSDWLTIKQGDCRLVLRAMPEDSIHAVVTSPLMALDADTRDAEWQATKARRTEPPAHIGGALATIFDSLGGGR